MSSNSSTNSMVIVAIPDEHDRVWKVSSQKVPHLTLLFLGDADKVANAASIVTFVQHAASRSLNRFYLPVDRRGELGMDKADVLYFKKGRYDFKAVRDFRSLLLKDDNIKTAYDSTSQFEFPESVGAAGQPWIPHLTLGYPDSPAKPMPDDWDSNFYSVDFSKIAVWMGDYDGPEFLLKDYWDEMEESGLDMDTPLSVAMSNLEHHGVKGMKWGVRKVEGGGPNAHININQRTGEARTSNATTAAIVVPAMVALPLVGLAFLHPRVRAEVKAARAVNKGVQADKKWKKQIDKSKKAVEVHNAAADEINQKVSAFNNDKRWKGVDLTKDPAKQTAYDKAVETELLNPAYARAAIKVHGANSPGGRYKFEIKDPSTGIVKVKDLGVNREEVKHAAEDEMSLQLKITRDATGHIVGFAPEDDDVMAQADTAELGAEFMSHHGVKGMHWGERKADAERAASSNPANAIARVVNTTAEFVKDVQFESAVSDKESETLMDTEHEIHSKANKAFKDHDVPAIKAKPEHQQAAKLKNRLLHPFDKGTKAYRKEMREAYIKRVEAAANSMTNASGTRQYTIREQGGELPTSKYYWEVTTRHIQHADSNEVTIRLEVLMDKDGFITGTKQVENVMAQTIALGAEWLAHYGTKGMKWGVRNNSRSSAGQPSTPRGAEKAEAARRMKRPAQDVRARDTIGRSKLQKTKIIAKGGEDHPAAEDAIKVAIAQQKLKRSGLKALSNKELQDMQTRLNLERNVRQLSQNTTQIGRGRQFIKELTGFGKEFNESVNTGINTQRLIKQVS